MQFVPPTDPTRAEILKARVRKNRSNYEPVGINVGDLGAECDRRLWFDFRRTTPPERHDGKKLRRFETGNIEEKRIVDDFIEAGFEVTNQQRRVLFVGGHVRGKIDGEALGLPDNPTEIHLLECKATNDESFKELQRHGVQKTKPFHYAQCQIYMHGRGLRVVKYWCVNTDNDDEYPETIAYDEAYCLRMLARAERIIRSDDPPSKLHEDPNAKAAFVCKMCRHKGVCHDGDWPRRNCRTCIHATAITTSTEACWDCSFHNMPLNLAQQAVACPSHLFIPALVPGKQTDADPDSATVTYTLHSGETWVNGRAAER